MSVASKKALENISLYKAATTIEAVMEKYHFQDKEIIKLEGNENRLGCSKKVAEALADAGKEFAFYPDLNVTRLRELLTRKHGINGEQLIFGNGSFELITIIGSAYIEEGDEAICVTPSFNWYVNATLVNGGKVVYVPVNEKQQTEVDKIREAVTEKTKVIWICNPNNPTGALIPPKDLLKLVEEVPEKVLLVLDEAYIDFASEAYTDTALFAQKYENVILLRTFSKSYGLASFRLGYGIGNTEIINTLSKVKIPCNLNYAAQIAAIAALKDREHFRKVIENNRAGLERYYRAFDEFGFDYVKSDANFVFVHTGIDGTLLQQEFLKRAIMIRNGADYGYDDWLRITIGTPEENEKVIIAFKEIISELQQR